MYALRIGKITFLCRMISKCVDLTWKTALQAANALIFQHTGKYLSDVEVIVLYGAWNNHTYAKIAEATNYTSCYLCRDIGAVLWEKLATALKVKKVSKRNFRAVLRREWQKYTQAILSQNKNQLAQFLHTDNIILFEGLIALNSKFYIERSPVEAICYEQILKPGSLIRIEGAKWMGKTYLVDQILEQGNLQAQKTVYLDFDTIDQEIIQDLDKLLIWLSTIIFHQLNIENKLQDYCHNNYTAYFEKYILTRVEGNIILALDNLNCLFRYQKVAKAFLKLLCKWHKKSKGHYYWSRLKLITTQSTKTSVPFDINCSFFHLGTPILLEEFSFQQVKALASFYQLDWNDWEISRLMNEVGGNPYLVRLAMYQTKIKNLTLRH
jgi:hypothetical protein